MDKKHPQWVASLRRVLQGTALVTYIGLLLVGFSLHYWTVSIIYHHQGRGPAIFALLFPVGAEVFWAIKAWRDVGFGNLYTLVISAYGLLWVLLVGLFAALETSEHVE